VRSHELGEVNMKKYKKPVAEKISQGTLLKMNV